MANDRTTVARIAASAALAFAISIPCSTFAQSAENVAVIINETSPASQQIGEHYIRARAIPEVNVVRIRTSTSETIEREQYGVTIEQPIATALSRRGLQDRVLYLVLTKGIPLRIRGTSGVDGTVSSVDSELTLLYRRMTGRTISIRGRVANPYFLGTKPVSEAQPFTHRSSDIFLVSRLDAFTIDEAIAMIDRAQAPSRGGRIVLDQRGGWLREGAGDKWLAEAAQRLTELGQGDRVVLEETTRGARDLDEVLGYYSWGSNDPANRARRYNMRFVAGALAATFVSSDGRTFQNPPDDWVPTSDWDNRKTWFGGSPQSLIGDLIRDGVTGAAGHVAEPYLRSAARPEILFPAYLAGFNLIESFYLALPDLSWQAIVVGDPLCAPFRQKVLTRSDLEEPVDPETELPGLFSMRSLIAVQDVVKDAPRKAVALVVLGGARLERGDTTGAKQALEQATELAPQLLGAQMQLAALYEAESEPKKAVERYRTVVKLNPNNLVALNNLAYGLAVHLNAAKEALPLARKAVASAPQNPAVLDTLAWIEHLLGNDRAAAELLIDAVQRAPANAEIRLHAAIVLGEIGDIDAATAQLNEALRLNSALEMRDEVRQLRKRLGRKINPPGAFRLLAPDRPGNVKTLAPSNANNSRQNRNLCQVPVLRKMCKSLNPHGLSKPEYGIVLGYVAPVNGSRRQ